MLHVWGIGLTRTGTSSLHRALSLLGISSVHWPTTNELLHRNLQAATDESVAAVFKYLDFRHPGSKFILTERDEESWIRSTEAHRRLALDPVRAPGEPISAALGKLWADDELRDRAVEVAFTHMALYGTVDFDERKFRDGFRRHHAEVERWFAQRPQDLLRIRICDGEGWEKLAPFLGCAIPAQPFPHENATSR
jgi:Sulfotransferase domain